MSRVFITAALALGTIAGALLVGGYASAGGDPPSQTPTYTTAQAARGSETYTKTCFVCHGANLDDGQFASPLKGPAFRQKWGGQGLDALFTIMTTQMPPDNPGGLGAATYADVLAFILSKNNVAPSPDRELPADMDALKGMLTPQE